MRFRQKCPRQDPKIPSETSIRFIKNKTDSYNLSNIRQKGEYFLIQRWSIYLINLKHAICVLCTSLWRHVV